MAKKNRENTNNFDQFCKLSWKLLEKIYPTQNMINKIQSKTYCILLSDVCFMVLANAAGPGSKCVCVHLNGDAAIKHTCHRNCWFGLAACKLWHTIWHLPFTTKSIPHTHTTVLEQKLQWPSGLKVMFWGSCKKALPNGSRWCVIEYMNNPFYGRNVI